MPASSAEVSAAKSIQSGARPDMTGVRNARNPVLSSGAQGIQSIVFPALVALGCWGMAFSFFFFYADPNKNLYAGLAALMALCWTVIFALRMRKMRQLRQGRQQARA
jgi:hypothetical protein